MVTRLVALHGDAKRRRWAIQCPDIPGRKLAGLRLPLYVEAAQHQNRRPACQRRAHGLTRRMTPKHRYGLKEYVISELLWLCVWVRFRGRLRYTLQGDQWHVGRIVGMLTWFNEVTGEHVAYLKVLSKHLQIPFLVLPKNALKEKAYARKILIS